MNEAFPALVISTGKNVAWVALDSEDLPRIAQIKRAAGKRVMVVPGDRVWVRVLEDGRTVIDRTDPRACTLERRLPGRSKTMAANVDTLVTVTSLGSPPPRLLTLDQLLVFAEIQGLTAIVVLTKPDRAQSAERARIESLYGSLGYRTMVVNPKRGEGVDEVARALSGRKSMLAGVSGVGKSSIFRALGGVAVVGDVSAQGLGKQTTTSARLCRLEGGGFLIDSPGVSQFGLGTVGPAELAQGFPELRSAIAHCRFSDCSHLREPGCAVRSAVESGTIDRGRYASFGFMLTPAG